MSSILRRSRIRKLTVLLSFLIAAQSTFADTTPPERANQASAFNPFSVWDIQGLYGTSFREPGVHEDVAKGTATLENSSAWSWGSNYFFLDYLRSDSHDQNATEFYGEWYPSASITRITGKPRRLPFLRDVLLTMGFNAGSKNTGAAPLVFLPGFTFDLNLPAFQFFSVGTYVYIDRGRMNGTGNGCNQSTYQITPSWSLPFALGKARFRFDGFVDFIGAHGQCASQIVSQPTIKLDVGNFRGAPDKLLAGVEWAYWKNKYGISGLNQTAPQFVVMWVL